jgi:hypothetical protein
MLQEQRTALISSAFGTKVEPGRADEGQRCGWLGKASIIERCTIQSLKKFNWDDASMNSDVTGKHWLRPRNVRCSQTGMANGMNIPSYS